MDYPVTRGGVLTDAWLIPSEEAEACIRQREACAAQLMAEIKTFCSRVVQVRFFTCGLPFKSKTFLPITSLVCFYYSVFLEEKEKRMIFIKKNIPFRVCY